MTLEQALAEIAEGKWRMNEWAYGELVPPTVEAHMDGESSDGEPTWHVFDRQGHGWLLRKIGWYEQRGDWDGYDGLIKLAHAMDAADDALEATLKEFDP